MRLAANRFQISWYKRNWSLDRDSFTCVGVRAILVGRMASWASWIFPDAFFSLSRWETYWLPYCSSMKALAVLSAYSATRVESVLR